MLRVVLLRRNGVSPVANARHKARSLHVAIRRL